MLKVNTLISHDLEHGAGRFESSTPISLVELNSTELEMISNLILNSDDKATRR
jgi:hypothetical protein